MELEFKNYKYKDNKLSFTIKEKEINGITGNHLDEIISLIKLNSDNIKNIFVNNKELKEKDYYDIKRKISYIPESTDNKANCLTIEEDMIEYIKKREVYPKNLQKKLRDSLKIVGLDASLLERYIFSLSTSEKKLVQIAKELLLNPEIIILEEPLKVLDMKNRKKIMMVLKRIKDQYNKAIVIASIDPEVLLKETEHLIIYKNDKIIINENTLDAYKQVDYLKKHKIDLPEIIEITYLAIKNKNIKIDYFKDIRDIIKDIYKHV